MPLRRVNGDVDRYNRKLESNVQTKRRPAAILRPLPVFVKDSGSARGWNRWREGRAGSVQRRINHGTRNPPANNPRAASRTLLLR